MRLDALRGRLIVSVQAKDGSALDDPAVLAAMAREAQDAGAAGLRMQGTANIAAARARTTVPMIGIVSAYRFRTLHHDASESNAAGDRRPDHRAGRPLAPAEAATIRRSSRHPAGGRCDNRRAVATI